jgi:hypothetical protein
MEQYSHQVVRLSSLGENEGLIGGHVETFGRYGARVGGAKTLKLFHFKCFSLCGHR